MSAGNDNASGSGKSEVEIAFELVNKLKGQGVWGEKNLGPILDMFAECLDAAKGLRAYPGQNRIDTPVKTQSQSAAQTLPTAQTQAQIQAQAQAKAQAQAQIEAKAKIEAQRQAQLEHAQALAQRQTGSTRA